MKRQYKWALVALVLLLGFGIFQATRSLVNSVAGWLSGDDNPNAIVLTYDGWSGTYLPMHVLKVLLEERLDYDVRIYEADDIPDAFAAVGDGRSDVFTSAWFPIRDFTFSKHPNLVKLGTVYGGSTRDAFEGIMVNRALAQQHEIRHLRDLARPEVVRLLDSNGDGRGELLGCPSDWACAASLPTMLQEYELGALYTVDVPRSEEAMIDRVADRLRREEPALFYMLQPVALPARVDLPEQATWLQGTETFLPVSFNRNVVQGDFLAHHPEVAQLLATYRIPGADVSAAMDQIARNGTRSGTLTRIAQDWIADNEALVDSWFEDIDTVPVRTADESLTIAYTPEKEELFLQLVIAYNRQRSEEMLPITPVRMEMRAMFNGVAQERFAAMSPDSSIWLAQFDRAWQSENPGAASLIGERHRYALSPIVIAMWEEVATELGYPERPIGWQTLIDQAAREGSFRWSHQSTHTASGLLTTTALFYAGAGKSDDLTQADISAEDTLAFVTAVQSTVARYGGESEDLVVVRMLAEGGQPLDAFVAQEQLVTFYNQHRDQGADGSNLAEKLIAIYPEEGTLWMDHPLALLDAPWVSDTEARTFRAFAAFVSEPAQQAMVLANGYRPSDLGLPLDGPTSPLQLAYGVDPAEPRRLLNVPAPGVLEDIRELWQLTKKPANIYLVVDISGSMEGEKLAATQSALRSFLAQVQGERDQLGLIAFNDTAYSVEPLATLDPTRRTSFGENIDRLTAGGGTHLYSAIAAAHQTLAQSSDADRINVIVAMTDGMSQDELRITEQALASSDLPILIFTVAYGEDADIGALQQVARLGNGVAYPSDAETIEQLYELLSAFF